MIGRLVRPAASRWYGKVPVPDYCIANGNRRTRAEEFQVRPTYLLQGNFCVRLDPYHEPRRYLSLVADCEIEHVEHEA